MSSVVFILGAGASRECGGPLMADFLDIASDLLLTGKVAKKRVEFEKVFDAIGKLQIVHSKSQLDLVNIESILTALELGLIIRRVPGLAIDEIPQIISALKDLIVSTLEARIRFKRYGNDILPPAAYENFAKLVKYIQEGSSPKHTVSVITFNYDVAVDMALRHVDLGPDYVISAPSGIHNAVPLLKLHGSLNWASEHGSKNIRVLHLDQYFQHYQLQLGSEALTVSLPIGTHLSEYFAKYTKLIVDAEPVIIPPTWNKADYHHALTDVWASAAMHLSEAKYIYVIGYSLPPIDSFFRHLFALGSVGDTTIRKFAVFNPDTTGEVDRRFKDLLGSGASSRYEYFPLTFGSSLEEIRRHFPSTRS